MYAICIIGMTKQGKSRYTREKIVKPAMQQGLGCLVYDVNDEYGEYRRDRDSGALVPSIGLQTDTRLYCSRYAKPDMNMREFMEIVKTKKHTTVIFEEATGFFKGRTNEDLCKMIINKGHTINNYVFLFHSMRSVPPELLGLMDFLVLFKTSDEEILVKQKSQKLLPYWLDLQQKPDGAKPWVLNWLTEKPFDKNRYEMMKQRLGYK